MGYRRLDGIQEVKVLTSNYGAQYGRTASVTVQVTTKSGTATFHGNIYDFVRNEAFNSRNFFDFVGTTPPTPGQTVGQTIGGKAPLYRRQDFGGTIGGPLYIPGIFNTKKDKIFFFFSEELRMEKTPTDYNQAVPGLKERGLFLAPDGTIRKNLKVDPTTGTVFQDFDFSDVCSPTASLVVRSQFPDCPAILESDGLHPIGNFLGTGHLNR